MRYTGRMFTANCISNSLNMLEDYSVFPEGANSSAHYSDVDLSPDQDFLYPGYMSAAATSITTASAAATSNATASATATVS